MSYIIYGNIELWGVVRISVTDEPMASHIDRGRNWVVVEGPSLNPHCGLLSSMGKTSTLDCCQKSRYPSQPSDISTPSLSSESRDNTKEQ